MLPYIGHWALLITAYYRRTTHQHHIHRFLQYSVACQNEWKVGTSIQHHQFGTMLTRSKAISKKQRESLNYSYNSKQPSRNKTYYQMSFLLFDGDYVNKLIELDTPIMPYPNITNAAEYTLNITNPYLIYREMLSQKYTLLSKCN